ncbi:MAG: SpoIIE family protein phosphatase [Candidatus Eisenbacteria bacterium]|nr:SpoIIE family protein phosphatase [Candidatus Latescibacterota bacterium]MBD3301546.1 SpoIIE family protein phosphatase [Candidatus Eisenbacteria bacterium]
MDAPRLRIVRFFSALWVTALAAAVIVEASRLGSTPFLGMSEKGNEVGLVIEGGPADRAGIRVGDRIIAIDGERIPRRIGPAIALRWGAPGEPMRLTVRRNGAIERIALVPEAPPRTEVLWGLARAAAALLALFVGSVVWMRRSSTLTFVFFLICSAFSLLLFFPHVPPATPFAVAANIGKMLLNAFLPALFLHFFLLFPYERMILRKRPKLPHLLYLAALVLFALNLVHALELFAAPIDGILSRAVSISTVGLFAASLLASLGLFARAFQRTKARTIRRKIRVALWGTAAGVLPSVAVLIYYSLFPGRTTSVDRLAVLALVLVPAGFAYAIVKHGVFDIERIVKRSLVITSITATLILVYFLSYFLLRALLDSVTNLSETLISVLAFLFVIVLFSPIRSRIGDFIDRSIYPERFASRRRLQEFARNLPQLSSETEIVRVSLQSIANVLGVEKGAYFPAGRPSGSADYSWGLSRGAAEGLRLGSLLRDPIHRGERSKLLEEVQAAVPYGYLPEEEETTLEALDAAVLLPIGTRESRFGVAVLGGRLDGDPYSVSDLEILDSLASQTSLAMENARFHRELETKEALARELIVAQTVQRQLLPQSAPSIPGVELTAAMLPCYEVGGDYYDYVSTPQGRILVAVGDVSGKGIPAAILMANVQALFRAEARDGVEPDRILEAMNRRLCEIERPERFVSFFVALLDPERGELRYSGAGHPPPLLVRFDGSLHHLDAAGLLLGIEPEAAYPLGVVRLRPGDLMLCYTDGIPDPYSNGFPIREDHLEEMARTLRHLPAERLLDRIVERIREAEDLQDDTTILILKSG